MSDREKFYITYKSMADSLTVGVKAPEAAARMLADDTFDRLSPSLRDAPTQVRRVMMTLRTHGLCDEESEATAVAGKKIFGQDTVQARYVRWAPFLLVQSRLGALLYQVDVVTRLLAATNILGWHNQAISQLIFDGIDACRTGLQKDTLGLGEAEAMLKKFRRRCASRVRKADTYRKWLRKLILRKDDIALEARAVDELRRIVSNPHSFGLKGHVKPTRGHHKGLRDRWANFKRKHAEALKFEMFCEDSNERTNHDRTA